MVYRLFYFPYFSYKFKIARDHNNNDIYVAKNVYVCRIFTVQKTVPWVLFL